MLSFSVSDIKMEEGMFINLVEKHEELTDKKTKKAEQKSILKNDYLEERDSEEGAFRILQRLMHLRTRFKLWSWMLLTGKKTMFSKQIVNQVYFSCIL